MSLQAWWDRWWGIRSPAGHTRRAQAAAREAELSRQRLADARAKVIEPLKAYAAHNSFAELIAQSLAEGRGNGRLR
jgi:hypothetical protein